MEVSEAQPMESESSAGFNEPKLHEVIAKGSLDFDEWTSRISETEKMYPDDIEKICLVYDSFLSEFPLCYGYWRKYADHKTRLCTVDKVVEIFERAVQSATYSVAMWFDYCSFGVSVFEDPSDIRRLFRRGMSFVGKDYLCHTLWDKYIEFEFSQQHWSSLAHIYIQALRFPTKKLHHYYDSFKKLVAFLEEEMECQNISAMGKLELDVLDSEVPICYKDDNISHVIKDLLNASAGLARSKALLKYLSIGEGFYQEACQLGEKIRCFESNIRRSYFHANPLDVSQLENWHHYLDFVEMQGDFDWAVKLYERCLIPCANYAEFWVRCVEFMESKGGREIANYALHRSTLIFLKRVPVIHLCNARFKEHIGDVLGARAAFLLCETESDSNFVENVTMKANMEKRMGNFEAASNIYREALEMAALKKKLHTLPILYVHFSRLIYMITDNADAAREVLLEGIKHVPGCKLLLEELVNFTMMHGGPRHISLLGSVIANAISPRAGVSQGLNAKDAEAISSLYLEFVDLCGTINDVRKAWNRHIQLFPHSVRIASYKHLAAGGKTLKEGGEETYVAKSHQPSGDSSSDCLIQFPSQDEKMLLPENHDAQPDQAPTDHISEQKLALPENHDIQFELVTIDQLQSGEVDNCAQEIVKQASPKVSDHISEQKLALPENHDIQFELVTIDQLQSGEVDNCAQEIVEQASPKVSERPRDNTPELNDLSVDLVQVEQLALKASEQLKEDTHESNVSSLDLKQAKHVPSELSEQVREDTPESNVSSVQVANVTESVQASQECLKEYDVKKRFHHESEQDLKLPSLENLSLKTQNNRSPDSVPYTSHKCEAPQQTCMSNGSMLESGCDASNDPLMHSPLGTRAADSSRNETEVINPSSSANHQNFIPSQALSRPQVTANRGGGNRRQMNNAGRVRRDSKFGFRGHSQRKTHRKRHESPERYPRSELGAPTPTSQSYPSQSLPLQNPQFQQSGDVQNQYTAAAAPANLTVPNAWSMQNVQQQIFATTSQSQLPPQPVASQTSQFPMQSNGQYAHMQNSQTYSQMWQYYYYQQQQFLLQQQQQQQQPRPQLLQQQNQHQQLQLQQHYLQLQQQQPFQQQQQFQQNQEQYNQQQQLQLQHQQPYQQQQQHLLHLQQPIQQQQQLEQIQQQITPSEIQTWDLKHYQKQQASMQYDESTHSGVESGQPIVASLEQGATPPPHSGACGPNSQERSPPNR